MLTNVESGAVMMLGLNCLIIFYGQSLLTLLGSDGHSKIPSKCQACRRVHEHMTVVPAPETDTNPIEPVETPVTQGVPE
jgi:hypothetical protein